MHEQALGCVSRMIPSRSSDTKGRFLPHVTEQSQELSDALGSVQMGRGVLSEEESAEERTTKIVQSLANEYRSL